MSLHNLTPCRGDTLPAREGRDSPGRWLCPLTAPMAGGGDKVPDRATSLAWRGSRRGCAELPILSLATRLSRTHKLLTSLSPASSSCRSDIWRLPGNRGFCGGKKQSGTWRGSHARRGSTPGQLAWCPC